jgi:hypothetical protein
VELVSGEVGRLDNLLSQTLDYVRPIRLASDPVLLEDVLTQVLHHEEPWLATHEVRIRSIEKSTVPLQRHAQAAPLGWSRDRPHPIEFPRQRGRYKVWHGRCRAPGQSLSQAPGTEGLTIT